MSILQNIIFFILAIAILVTIHEFGHYWVAKKLGVKVLKFSVGFGKPLWSKRYGKDDTEFVIAAVPLGGYVKMLDEREGPVPAHLRDRAFNNKPVQHRIAVVAAGPIFNFLFAIAAYWLMFVLGVTGVKPIIGDVTPDTPAYVAGIQHGHEILSIDGDLTPTWSTFVQKCINKIVDGEPLVVTIKDTDGYEKALNMDLTSIKVDDLSKGNLLEQLGVSPKRFPLPAVIEKVVKDSPAERAGLQPKDKILVADGQTINNWNEWVAYVQKRPEIKIETQVLRNDSTITLELIPELKVQGEKSIGMIGAIAEHHPLDEKYLGQEIFNPLQALQQGVYKTWEMSALTLKLMGKMIVGEASVKNLSGPISIAEFAGKSADLGLTAFLSFLALVSVSLGVLNLLPIPILDGGHLLYYIVEWIMGKPVSESVQVVGQNIGILLLVAMMSIAFYNDIVRHMP